MPRRIAILMTTVDPSEFATRHLDDGQKFRALLQPLRPDWTFHVFAVRDSVFPADPAEFDGFLITGSPASVHDDYPWIERLAALVRDLHGRRVPLVGICFGHQLIARALGGSVIRNPGGWSLGTETIAFPQPLPWMQPPVAEMTLYSAHLEQVGTPPGGARTIGGNAACPVGAFVIGNHIMTIEYHPEMYPEFMSGLIEELDGKLPEGVLARARSQAARPTDGALFGRWTVTFLEQAARPGGPGDLDNARP